MKNPDLMALAVPTWWSTDGNEMERIFQRLGRLYLVALHLQRTVVSGGQLPADIITATTRQHHSGTAELEAFL
jgi:hypothetical protein